MDAYVLLEDGLRFDGHGVGATGTSVGEVVFNTSMTGYQEAVTDPSYRGQLITFTYPLIGNYGASSEAMESSLAHARGVIMAEAKNYQYSPSCEAGWLDWLGESGVVAITGIDTRSLVRHVRDKGAMRGGIFPKQVEEGKALEMLITEPAMSGQDLVKQVTPATVTEIKGSGSGPKIAVLDCGIKNSITRNLVERGCSLLLLPATTSSEEILSLGADALFLANGPGDPAALDYVVETTRNVVGKLPIVGICLGHQILCRAVGLETFKLKFGHRGANHPVKDLRTGRIEITAQNHGFAVSGPNSEERLVGDQPVRWETDFGAAELSHINLYDRTVEGLEMTDVSSATVQYHPEAGPGPHDSLYLFDRFIELIDAQA